MRNIDLDAERRFENEKVAGDYPRRAQSKFYWATAPAIDEFDQRIAEGVRGRTVLEIGCTDGHLSRTLARHAAHVKGVDISDAGIGRATAVAEAEGITNCRFVCCDAHRLPFADDSFDACVAMSVLHHLDLAHAVREIERVLRPGGVLMSREPLGTNPFFQLYRSMTPGALTVDERPLDRDDLALLGRAFDLGDSEVFGLTSVLAAFARPVPGAPWLRDRLIAADDLLARTPARSLFWQITIVGHSRKTEAALPAARSEPVA